jgi:hypothetical protein
MTDDPLRPLSRFPDPIQTNLNPFTEAKDWIDLANQAISRGDFLTAANCYACVGFMVRAGNASQLLVDWVESLRIASMVEFRRSVNCCGND